MSTHPLMIEIKLIDKGYLKAFADVTLPANIGEITLRGFRVIQKDGQQPWVGFPTISYSKNGKTVNNPVVEVSRSVHREIAEAILREYELLRSN